MKTYFERLLVIPQGSVGTHMKIVNMEHFLDVFGNELEMLKNVELSEEGKRLMKDVSEGFFASVADGCIPERLIGNYSDNGSADFTLTDVYFDECNQLVAEYTFLSTIGS